jgi:hypothetical protein
MSLDDCGSRDLYEQYQAAERTPPPLIAPEPTDFAVFTAGWLIGLALRESPGGVAAIEPIRDSPASARIVTLTGRKLLIQVTEETA